MLGYYSVKRNVLNRVGKVTRDGADETSGGRQFHMRASNREFSAANSGAVKLNEVYSPCRKSEVLGDLEG